jgi:hypothetical protein
MSNATTVNVWANFFNTVVGILLTADVTAVEAYIAAQMPILEAPWLSWFTNDVIQQIADALQNNVAMIGDGIIIDAETGNEVSDVQLAYKVLMLARSSGNIATIAAATRVYFAAAAALAHSDGSSTNSTTNPS